MVLIFFVWWLKVCCICIGIVFFILIVVFFVLLVVVFFVVLILYFMFVVFSYLFFDWQGMKQGGFVGVVNYIMFFIKEFYVFELWNVFGYNLLLFVGVLVFQNFLGFGIVILLYWCKCMKCFFQMIFVLFYFVSLMVIGYFWLFMLLLLFGFVNVIFCGVGLESLVFFWFGDFQFVIWVIVLVSVWQWIGFFILFYGVVFGGIFEEIEEVVLFDGVIVVKCFCYIMLFMFILMIGIIMVFIFIGSMEVMVILFVFVGLNGVFVGFIDVMMFFFYCIVFEFGNLNLIGVFFVFVMVLFFFIMVILVVIIFMMCCVE